MPRLETNSRVQTTPTRQRIGCLRRIALDFGPDHVIFPNLCDQPIMDLLL